MDEILDFFNTFIFAEANPARSIKASSLNIKWIHGKEN